MLVGFWGCMQKQKVAQTTSEEIIKIWNKLGFPSLSEQQILFKVDKVIKLLEKHRQRQNIHFEENLPRIYDITKPNGSWPCNEDPRTGQ